MYKKIIGTLWIGNTFYTDRCIGKLIVGIQAIAIVMWFTKDLKYEEEQSKKM